MDEPLAEFLIVCRRAAKAGGRELLDWMGRFAVREKGPAEKIGEQVFHDAGLTRTDEIGTLRTRVAELEQQLLDRRQDLQDRDDELAAARAANRDLMTRLNSRAPRSTSRRAQHV